MSVAAPLATGDRQALASALHRLAQLNPDPENWGRWSAWAAAGADAAENDDRKAIKRSCRRCHMRYRALYIERYRTRPVAD